MQQAAKPRDSQTGNLPDLTELLAEIQSRRFPSDRKGPTMKQFTDAVMAICHSKAEGYINDAETEQLLQYIGNAWAVSNFYNLLEKLAESDVAKKSLDGRKSGIMENIGSILR